MEADAIAVRASRSGARRRLAGQLGGVFATGLDAWFRLEDWPPETPEMSGLGAKGFRKLRIDDQPCDCMSFSRERLYGCHSVGRR